MEEKKETRGRKPTGRKLKSISFSIDSELYDQYNKLIKEMTEGTKKNGAGISLNTFVKNKLDGWINSELIESNKNEIMYIPDKEMIEKMRKRLTFGGELDTRTANRFLKKTIEKEIKSRTETKLELVNLVNTGIALALYNEDENTAYELIALKKYTQSLFKTRIFLGENIDEFSKQKERINTEVDFIFEQVDKIVTKIPQYENLKETCKDLGFYWSLLGADSLENKKKEMKKYKNNNEKYLKERQEFLEEYKQNWKELIDYTSNLGIEVVKVDEAGDEIKEID